MKPRDRAVMAIFFGPAAALADEVASYAILRHTLLVTVVSAAITIGGGAMAYRVLRRKTDVFDVDRWVAVAGLLLNAFFLFVIVFGFGIPKLVLHPTD